jgi:hypothetical protein
VKVLRTERGTELQGRLTQFCVRNGIVRQYSAPYVPEQNGRAERLNKMLAERTRALLLEHEVSKRLWPDAMCTANYLRNRIPASSQEKSPYVLMYHRKPEVGHLRVFGCKGNVIRLKKDRDKFEEVGEECMLVGYPENSKAWRVLVRRDGKLKHIESPNVRFSEDIAAPLKIHLRDGSKEDDENDELDVPDITEPGHDEFGEDAMGEASAGSGDLDETHEELEATASSDLDDLGNDQNEEEAIDVFSNPEAIDVFSNPAFDAGEESEEDSLPGRYPTRHRVKPSRFGFDAYNNSTVLRPKTTLPHTNKR